MKERESLGTVGKQFLGQKGEAESIVKFGMGVFNSDIEESGDWEADHHDQDSLVID